MSKETWKDIPGFEGIYQASNIGRIKSLDRLCESALGNSGFRLVRERILKQKIFTRHGRLTRVSVNLSIENGCVTHTVGKLVLMAFVRDCRDGEVCHFIDGNPANASLDNLEWSTYSKIAKQIGYAPPIGLRGKTRRSLGMTIDSLTPQQREVAVLIANGFKQGEISELLSRSVHTVRTHRYNIYRALGINRAAQLAVICASAGLVTDWEAA